MLSDSTYLSMTELARRLDMPESTMRYYCKRFAEFLPYKGEGRRRRYAAGCEKTLVFIASAMHRHKNATAVEMMLQSGQFGLVAPPPSPQADAAPEGGLSPETARLLVGVMERQAEAMGKIAVGLEAFVSRLGKAAEPASCHEEAAGQPGGLQNEVETLKQQIFTAEQVHQEDLEQLRKWIAHISEAVAKLS